MGKFETKSVFFLVLLLILTIGAEGSCQKDKKWTSQDYLSIYNSPGASIAIDSKGRVSAAFPAAIQDGLFFLHERTFNPFSTKGWLDEAYFNSLLSPAQCKVAKDASDNTYVAFTQNGNEVRVIIRSSSGKTISDNVVISTTLSDTDILSLSVAPNGYTAVAVTNGNQVLFSSKAPGGSWTAQARGIQMPVCKVCTARDRFRMAVFIDQMGDILFVVRFDYSLIIESRIAGSDTVVNSIFGEYGSSTWWDAAFDTYNGNAMFVYYSKDRKKIRYVPWSVEKGLGYYTDVPDTTALPYVEFMNPKVAYSGNGTATVAYHFRITAPWNPGSVIETQTFKDGVWETGAQIGCNLPLADEAEISIASNSKGDTIFAWMMPTSVNGGPVYAAYYDAVTGSFGNQNFLIGEEYEEEYSQAPAVAIGNNGDAAVSWSQNRMLKIAQYR